jgi:hypothetical protein
MVCRARLRWRSPKRLRRCLVTRPEDASSGLTSASAAKALRTGTGRDGTRQRAQDHQAEPVHPLRRVRPASSRGVSSSLDLPGPARRRPRSGTRDAHRDRQRPPGLPAGPATVQQSAVATACRPGRTETATAVGEHRHQGPGPTPTSVVSKGSSPTGWSTLVETQKRAPDA